MCWWKTELHLKWSEEERMGGNEMRVKWPEKNREHTYTNLSY